MNFRTLASQLVNRARLANVAGRTFNGKRDIYKALGYQRELFPVDYRSRFTRNAIANRVVKAPALATWHGQAEVLEEEDPSKDLTQFEAAWQDLEMRLNMWSMFRRTDILAGINRFAVLLMGLPGDMITPIVSIDPETNEMVAPVRLTAAQISGLDSRSQPRFDGKLSDEQQMRLAAGAAPQFPRFEGSAALKYVRPYSEEDAKVFKFDLDPMSPRFGQPLFYNLTRTTMLSPESTNSNVIAKVVHWSRLNHVADGLLDDLVYGEPRLQCVWNLIDDLEKVEGAGSEAFWRRVDRGIQFDLDPTLEFDAEETKPDAADPTSNAAVKKQIEEMEHGLRNYLFTRGVKVKEMSSNVANFAQNCASIISMISAGTGIPQRLLMGSERGELSSSQDKEEWNERIHSRREEFAGPHIVRPFIDRMIAIGVLPKPEQDYWVRWPSIAQMTETQRATLAQQYIALNKEDTIVTRDEIRDVILGLPPMTEEQEAGEASTWDQATKASHISVNEKRKLTGLPPWEGDIDLDPYADIPADLLPKESLKITDTDVPINAPGGKGRPQQPKLPGTPGAGGGPPKPQGAAGAGAPKVGAPALPNPRVPRNAKGAATETHVHRAADRFRAGDEARRARLLRSRQEGRPRRRIAVSPSVKERAEGDADHVYGRDGIRKALEG